MLGGMKRWGVVGILLLAFLGLADSVYLAQHAVNGTPLLCNINFLSGCNTVAASPYAYLFGIPLAEFGVLFYSILFVLAALELALFNQVLRRALQVTAAVGLFFSLYFTSLQMFVIEAFCIYCVISALITIFVVILASFIEPVWRRKNGNSPIITPPPRLSMPPRP